ncbi:malate dehydrogenase [Fervidibacter sacchari]|jgi:malate dehydrogenase (NAD) (EC 1.1.1.37)|uniref:Malate dehydrogenase n=1 Tax=Candidatus Fervidibacter sacchari TaxID=1448929 RepID=A0ABT2EP90_9BACT|nr:malate dehydrogenase [Candidatus Fervidibacter sacchari]MCS3919775.1 malate dehydrogenase [Candidatus Fervidibacter sacchari]WKU16979.1 malate dehydrogenase [Candidatus Fervidibacter sacchari]
MLGKPKISVVGAGMVGSSAALKMAQKELGDIVLVDVVEFVAEGKALDMAESSPLDGFDVALIGKTNDYSVIKDSDVVVITAGVPRKPGMTRMDLLMTNAGIVETISNHIRELAPNSIVIVVTNPLDVMTYVAWKVTGFPRERVMGQAGVLDSIRMRYFVAQELGVSVKDVQAMVLGSHGDQMVPLPRYTTVSGVPITELLPPETIERINDRTRKAGTEIVNLLKTGSAYYAPGAAVAEMVEAIVRDKKRLMPCSVLLKGEYGLNDVFIGVPVILGKNGVERIVELKLTEEELKALHQSAEEVRKGIADWEGEKAKAAS